MPNIAGAYIAGNVGRDPELRFTQGGQGVTNFSVAVSRSYKDRSDEWQEVTSWFNVTAWGQFGENLAATITKGMRVVLVGRFEQRSWENDDGEKRSAVDFIAEDGGPSLMWATAAVDKIEKETADDRRSPRSSRAPSRRQRPEEEPF